MRCGGADAGAGDCRVCGCEESEGGGAGCCRVVFAGRMVGTGHKEAGGRSTLPESGWVVIAGDGVRGENRGSVGKGAGGGSLGGGHLPT